MIYTMKGEYFLVNGEVYSLHRRHNKVWHMTGGDYMRVNMDAETVAALGREITREEALRLAAADVDNSIEASVAERNGRISYNPTPEPREKSPLQLGSETSTTRKVEMKDSVFLSYNNIPFFLDNRSMRLFRVRADGSRSEMTSPDDFATIANMGSPISESEANALAASIKKEDFPMPTTETTWIENEDGVFKVERRPLKVSRLSANGALTEVKDSVIRSRCRVSGIKLSESEARARAVEGSSMPTTETTWVENEEGVFRVERRPFKVLRLSANGVSTEVKDSSIIAKCLTSGVRLSEADAKARAAF